MSSELCTEDQKEVTRLSKEQDEGVEEEEVEVLRPDNVRNEVSSSVDCNGIQEVTSEGGQDQDQREETQPEKDNKKFPHMTVKQDSQARGSGACLVQRYHRRSFPKDMVTCSNPDRDRERPVEEPRGGGPFYFFGGSNGAEIVKSYCESKGWKRIHNKHREDFKLKWCESKSSANYSKFREGEQLLYQIPNNYVLTTKIGLLSSLREYERVSSKVSHGRALRQMKMEEFIPTTFRMDVKEEREAFFTQQEGERNKSSMWICKPTGLNQGRGIFLLKSEEELTAFRLKLQHMEANRKPHHCQPQARIVQHYIQNPLLLKGKKFDVRSYLLIACTAPYMVFFRHGYVRLTCDLYDPGSNNLSAHLTNQYMQKKNPLYSELKEDTVWSMESFNAYVNDRFQVAKGLPRDWVLGAFAKRMQQIMTQCFYAVKSKLDCRLGFFDLIGCDFMVDEDFKVWLLEMNCNPALHTNCEVLKEVIPSTVEETLDLALEIFNKSRLKQRILPLAAQREFVLLYSGVFAPDSTSTSNKINTNSQFHQKTNKNKNQKPEQSRCKSLTGTEDKHVPSAASYNFVNTSNGRERLSSSESDNLPCSTSTSTSTSTSPVVQNSSTVQGPSHLHNDCSQTIRNKNLRPRVQLKLNKCTFHHRLKDINEKQPNMQQKMQIIMSLTPPGLNAGNSDCDSPHTDPPVCVDKQERGEEPGEEGFSESTECLVFERKEEV